MNDLISADAFIIVVDASGVTATIVGGYPATGIYPVALRVTDDNPSPQTDLTVCDIYVHEPPHCPHMSFGNLSVAQV